MRYKTAIRSSYFLCLFALGSAFPFLPVFLKERLGLSNLALGLVLMVRPAMAILGQPFWSWMADSTRKRSHLASFLALMSAVLFPLILMEHRLPAVMLLLALSAFFVMPLNSMSDTITFDYLGESRRNHFGSLRIFASLGYFTAVMLAGPVYDLLGLRWLFLLFALGMLGSAWVIREVPSRQRSQRRTGFGWGPLLAFLKKRNVLFFLVAILVSETANQMAYIFLSIYSKSLGANNTQTGWIWAAGTGMEMLTMIAMPRIIHRMGLRRILILGTFFVLFRWAPLAFIHHWWLIFPFQCFHMITLTFIYVGAAIFMDAEASPAIRFSAQAFFSTFILNGSSLLGSILGGEISDRFGFPTLYLICGSLGVIAAALMFAFVHTPTHVRLPRGGKHHAPEPSP
jgi:MFS transporter, PPP family, 3-phenylpropionic acid transporter